MQPHTPTLFLRLLGGLELVRDGQVVPVSGRKNAALLACLGWHDGPVARARLLAWLWPDADEVAARASLRQALSALRRLAGEDLLQTAGDAVALGPDVDVDLRRFQQLAASPDPHDRAAALACHRGALLDGWDGQADELAEWQEELRARRAACAALLERVLQLALDEAGDDAAAQRALAERWLEHDPASERAYRALIDACRRQGDKSAGVRAYERCRGALSQAYGVSPSPDTEQVYRELLQGQAGADAASANALLVLPVRCFAVADEALRSALALLADGLTQDVTTGLTRFRDLSVLAAPATDLTPVEAARQARARFALSGHLRPAPAGWRLTMQLLDARDGATVWSESYDPRPVAPVPAPVAAAGAAAAAVEDTDWIAREIVAAIAKAVDTQVLARARHGGPGRSAYELWVQGSNLLQQGTLEADERARHCFEQALHIDPGYARAYTGLSLSWFNEWSCQHWDRWELTQREAYRHALRAVEMDPADHVSLCILGKIELYRRQFDAADAHFHRALRLNPNDPDNLAMVAMGLAYLGQAEIALELGQAAMRLNPRHPAWYWVGCYMPLLVLRRYDDTIRHAQPAAGLYVDTHCILAVAHAQAGRPDQARHHADCFLQEFTRKIDPRHGGDPGQAGRWVMDVSPMRLPADEQHLREGLACAGLW